MTPPASHHGAAVYVGWQVRAEVSLCLDRTSQACFEDVDITMIECKQSLNQGAKLKKDFVRTSAAHGPSWSHLVRSKHIHGAYVQLIFNSASVIKCGMPDR
eukprot:5735063-Pleurochrysis_carterae.AAC.1